MTLLYVLIGAAVILISLLIMMLIRDYRIRQKKRLTQTKHKSKRGSQLQRLYMVYSKFYFSRLYLLQIRKRLELVADYDEHKLRNEVSKLCTISLSLIIIALIASIIIVQSVYLIGLIVIVLYFIVESIVSYSVLSIKGKLLAQQLILNSFIRDKYHELNSVVDAIQEASEDLTISSPEIAKHGLRIAEILTHYNMEAEIENYNETAPNNYLKLLLGISYTASEFGDSADPTTGGSTFLANIGNISKSIEMEIMKRKKLDFALRAVSIFCLIPILFMGPMKMWASNLYQPLSEIYNSSTGLILEVSVYIVCFLGYFLIRRIQNLESNIQQNQYRRRNIKWLNAMVHYIVPVRMTKRRYRLEKLLKDSFSYQSLETFFSKKLLLSMAILVTSTILVFTVHSINRENLLNAPVMPEGFAGASLNYEDQLIAEETSLIDKKIILSLDRNSSQGEIDTAVMEAFDYDQKTLEWTISRITEKHKSYHNEYFKWYEFVGCIVLAAVGFILPNIFLMFQVRTRSYEAHNEVSQFQSIIMMMMGIERIDVYEIIEWMEKYAVIFKEPLEKCVSNYASGMDEAIDQVARETTFLPFQKLMHNLKIASDKLSIRKAFEELEREKAFFFETRKEENHQIISKKISTGTFVGLIPTLYTVFAYIITPMGIAAYNQMSKII